jgi:uncharacterized repeat protein (TIGR03803 family)
MGPILDQAGDAGACLKLGDQIEANAELELITPQSRGDADVRGVRSRVRKMPLTVTAFFLASWLVAQATAQTFLTLHEFDNYYAEGANPYAGLVLSDGVVYGTAKYEGNFRAGVVFAVRTDGTGFTNLHSFMHLPTEGGFPESELVISGNVVFGTSGGGPTDGGTVFKVNRDGTAYQTLRTLVANTDGGAPLTGLVLSGNSLYGTASSGGNSSGTVFRLNTDGTGFTNLHTFSVLSGSGTNNDGVNPSGHLVLSGNTLYGTAAAGGTYGGGTVFALNTDGSGFRTLYHFTATSGSTHPTNSDGANPQAGLVLSGSTLYRTTLYGGSSGNGTVFALSTDGTGFTNLHAFQEAIGSGPHYTNSEGIFPRAELVLNGNNLYGTAYGGGSAGVGTVFCLNTNGTGFEVLHSFSGLDGENPVAEGFISNLPALLRLSVAVPPPVTMSPATETVLPSLMVITAVLPLRSVVPGCCTVMTMLLRTTSNAGPTPASLFTFRMPLPMLPRMNGPGTWMPISMLFASIVPPPKVSVPFPSPFLKVHHSESGRVPG